MTDNIPPTVTRRTLLGGAASLAAAASFSLSMSGAVAAQVSDGDDSDQQTVSSPNGRIELTVDVADGTPSYSVSHDGTTVVGDSTLGFDFQDQPSFAENVTVTGSERSTTDRTWEPVWDQYDEIRNHHEELRVGLVETDGPERALTLAARAFDDGVAFRYIFPENSGFGEFVLTGERTRFAFEDNHTAWWIQNDYNSFEYEYGESKLTRIYEGSPGDGAHTPLTMRTDEGRYLAVHEADLVDYASMSLVGTGTDSTTFESELAPLPDGTKVSAEAPHRTPWRTVQVAERPGALIESNLVVNCNPPRDPADFPQGTDWIEPRKFMGIWWLMITSRGDWQYFGEETGNHGAQTRRMKQYMEFASEHGIPSVLVEGWNQGWDSYPGSGNTMDFSESYPDFDIEEVTEFGAQLEPPVEMTAHNETSGNISRYESQLQSEDDHPFEFYDHTGIHSIKTGYVADDGVSIDGQNHNHHCQLLVNHHHLVYQQAAEHRQMLEIHEPIKPTGERRRYPNVMTREGVLGQEYDSFGEVDPAHHVTFPFTRMLAGPIEYTPGIFDMESGSGGIETTRAKQLAMYPTYFSGLQMVADLPSSYMADQDPRFGVGEVFQAEYGDRDGFGTGARWANAQGEAYVTIEQGDLGNSVSFTVEAPSAGEYEVHVRYASANGDRSATVTVGEEETGISFEQTEYWNVWETASVTVTLDGGDNEVGLALVEGIGNFNVDSLAVTESSESMPEPETSPMAAPTFDAFQFIEDVPAAGWDDTVVVEAAIGEYTAVARQHGDEWFLGTMAGDDAHAMDVPLDFLGERSYVAEMYTDGADAHYDTNLTPVRIDEAIVDAETDLLSSMIASGGTAVRFRPASSDEVADLPTYERPSQDLTASIASDIEVQEPFIQVTGDNTGEYIGGTLLEVVIDGDVAATTNVRIPPNTADYTVQFDQTIDSGGTYDVTVQTSDGTALASQSVSVLEPDIVANLSDPSGDDNGPGTYTYPTGAAFENTAFDLQSFYVEQTEETYLFEFEVSKLYDASGSRLGFSPHMFVLWMHDPDGGDGTTSSLEDLSATVDFERPWHYRLAMSGSTVSVVDATGSTVTDEVDISVDLASDTVSVVVDRSAFDGADAGTFGVVAAVHATERDRLAAVEVDATGSAFGGAKEGAVENAPRIADVLTTFENPQSEVLEYSAETRATVPFVALGDDLPPVPDDGDTDETTTTEGDDEDAGTPDDTEDGDGPGFGAVSGILGTAGGAAYAARRLLETDSRAVDPEDIDAKSGAEPGSDVNQGE